MKSSALNEMDHLSSSLIITTNNTCERENMNVQKEKKLLKLISAVSLNLASSFSAIHL